ncbi:MAG: MFS transporter [Lewinellaceae bacterium]|nr:MFS transporter [Lewinellaceae bacterium]
MGLAFGVVALISPLLSSVSDYTGNQKWFMRMFCYLGVSGCLLLFGFEGRDQLYLGLAGVLLSTIGYSGSIVFYNAYLPAIATERPAGPGECAGVFPSDISAPPSCC